REVRSFLVQNGVRALMAFAQLGVAIGLMLVYSATLTLVFLSTAPLYVLLMRYSSKRLRPVFDELETAFAKYSSHQIDSIKGIETVKAMGTEGALRNLMLEQFQKTARLQ